MNARLAVTTLILMLLLTASVYARSPQQAPAAGNSQEDPAAASSEEVSAPKYCVARVEPLEPGAQESRVSKVDCYASSSEAIYVATDGAVSLPPDASVRDQVKALRRALNSPTNNPTNKSTAGSGNVTLAIDYIDSIYRGDFLIYQGPTTCSSTASYGFAFLPDQYNDQFSSTQGFGGCNRNILYEHRDYLGATLTCTPSCTGFGVMNDAASSRKMQSTCGEASCVSPDGTYISHFTGANCDGTEYYYLPYNSFAYQCRPDLSSGVLCGTARSSITAYSYRYGGQCYPNAWPGGNPLDNLVRVYR